jgi:hypothetical protein
MTARKTKSDNVLRMRLAAWQGVDRDTLLTVLRPFVDLTAAEINRLNALAWEQSPPGGPPPRLALYEGDD